MRVIVTRPGPQAAAWVNGLRAAGHDALALPLIEILGPPDPAAVRAAWQRLAQYQALMFVSANAVDHFLALRPAACGGLQAQDASGPRCWATGPGTVAALRQAGVPQVCIDAPDHQAKQFDSEALWQVVGAQLPCAARVLIVRGDGDSGDDGAHAVPTDTPGAGRDWLAARLQLQGASVDFVLAYARRAPQPRANALALLQVASADGSVWLFSSSEAVQNLCRMAPGLSWQQARAVATHARIAAAARAAGFARVVESRPALADLLASIESLA